MKIGGSTFIYNGISQDYSFIETLNCIYDLCDEIAFVYGGDDGTQEAIDKWCYEKMSHANMKPIHCANITKEEWEEQKGRQKLSYFSNLAIDMLETEWNFYLQCDEVIAERSFPNIREAIEHDVDAYLCTRYNLWRDPLSHLVVEQSRKPCSTQVIRLAKTKYRCYDDAESLAVPFLHTLQKEGVTGSDAIEIYHCGYIRDEIKQVVKSKNMLVDIFGLDMDARIGEKFDYRNFPFKGEDIQPVPLPLPKYMKKWAQERHPEAMADYPKQ